MVPTGSGKVMSKNGGVVMLPWVIRETTLTNWSGDGNWNLPIRVFQLVLLVAE